MPEKIGLVFDIDDTLYDQLQPFKMACDKLFSRFSIQDVYQLFLSREHYSNLALEATAEGRMTKEEMYIYRMQKGMADHGFAITAEEALEFQNVYKDSQKYIYMTDTMKGLLSEHAEAAQEKGDRVLAVISNGPADHQWNKARTLGVPMWIPEENIFMSGDIGYIKPDKRAFDYALEKLDIKPENAWYIGDSLRNDIAGAQNAGWHTIWVNRRPYDPGEVHPEYIVHSEEELRELLRKLTF